MYVSCSRFLVSPSSLHLGKANPESEVSRTEAGVERRILDHQPRIYYFVVDSELDQERTQPPPRPCHAARHSSSGSAVRRSLREGSNADTESTAGHDTGIAQPGREKERDFPETQYSQTQPGPSRQSFPPFFII
ncbi:hypothetical protein L209DRAFT_546787 [Thermothelomyces heterothallicus CBS 203.75]